VTQARPQIRSGGRADARSVLDIDSLSIDFELRGARVTAVRDVSLSVGRGEVLGVVGESGSGKSQMFLAAMGLLARNARATGRVRLAGHEFVPGSAAAGGALRSASAAMVFQDPQSALTPHLTIGVQMGEVLVHHGRLGRRDALEAAALMLGRVGIADPARCLGQYPHELSGGMRQRVLIGMSLLGAPQLLIADEPTSALDVSVQAQVLELLGNVRAERGLAIVLISHDLGVVAALADRIAVMYAGRIVETASARELLLRPHHPYTAALLACVPSRDGPVPSRMPTLPGRPPSGLAVTDGCAFAPRCSRRSARCLVDLPALGAQGVGRVACHHPLVP
jgi:oligopeptide/dipeptide ABC transporter ATP-binding protein